MINLLPEGGTVSIAEAAKHRNVSRQAIFFAIWSGRLKATKRDEIWFINNEDLNEYLVTKYSRVATRKNTEFKASKGNFSVNEAAKILKLHPQRLYYLIRAGKLKATTIGPCYAISQHTINQFLSANQVAPQKRRRKKPLL